MRFAISMTDLEGEWDGLPEDRQKEILSRHEAFEKDLRSAGKFVDALHFYPRTEAKTIRMGRDGSLTTSDGPFDDASEYIGGIYVIDAESIDQAVEWARRARFMVGANEVRQVWD